MNDVVAESVGCWCRLFFVIERFERIEKNRVKIAKMQTMPSI